MLMLYIRDGGYTTESFPAYVGSKFGVSLSCGDMDGDGAAEILTGLGPGPENKSIARIFRKDGTLIGEFQAYPDSMKYGVKISRGTIGE